MWPPDDGECVAAHISIMHVISVRNSLSALIAVIKLPHAAALDWLWVCLEEVYSAATLQSTVCHTEWFYVS